MPLKNSFGDKLLCKDPSISLIQEGQNHLIVRVDSKVELPYPSQLNPRHFFNKETSIFCNGMSPCPLNDVVADRMPSMDFVGIYFGVFLLLVTMGDPDWIITLFSIHIDAFKVEKVDE